MALLMHLEKQQRKMLKSVEKKTRGKLGHHISLGLDEVIEQLKLNGSDGAKFRLFSEHQ